MFIVLFLIGIAIFFVAGYLVGEDSEYKLCQEQIRWRDEELDRRRAIIEEQNERLEQEQEGEWWKVGDPPPF